MKLPSLLRRGSSATSGLSNGASRGKKGSGADTDCLRYCLYLALDAEQVLEETSQASAWKYLEESMALVPAGRAVLESLMPGSLEPEAPSELLRETASAEAVYMDRYAVTNADYAQFVAAGGYNEADLWPAEILPFVLQFVDRSGSPGPASWSNGSPPAKKDQHPVVGICWYEAQAYARWVGKRLPTSVEWQRAVTWSGATRGGDTELRYPWGHSFEPANANTSSGGCGDTVPVDQYYSGCTPNGIYQLIGNVWEWTSAQLEAGVTEHGVQLLLDAPMAEVRGGAFDTYFASQATAQFRSAQSSFARRANVGFRCCASADQLADPPSPAAFLVSAKG